MTRTIYRISLSVCLGLAIVAIPLLYQPKTQVEASPLAQPLAWPNIAFNQVITNLNNPVHVTNAGDGSGRLFVVEQSGRILIWESNTLSTFLNIQSRVQSGGEEGLLSIAFPPGFGSQRPHFYVYYTNLNGDNQVSRFQLSSNPDAADPSSEELIIHLPHPGPSNHNGGQIAFGPDGYLYIGTGDGGGGGDPNDHGQDLATHLGKILRIDVEFISHTTVPGNLRVYLPFAFQAANLDPLMYRLPPDNPYINTSGSLSEIWALGLRNPWRFSFDRATGDLYIADVGQGEREEIDFQPASSSGGENYGWNIMEGDICYGAASCNQTGLTLPVAVYNHNTGGCSVTGGHVYRGNSYPSMQGIYFYADYCSGRVWGLQKSGQNWTTQELTQTTYSVSSFGEGENGDLYIVDLGGTIYRIVESSP